MDQMVSFFDLLFILNHLMNGGERPLNRMSFHQEIVQGMELMIDGFDYLLEHKNITLNPILTTTLEFWYWVGTLIWYDSIPIRHTLKKWLKICSQKPGFGPKKRHSTWRSMLKYKNITLRPHHNFGVLVQW